MGTKIKNFIELLEAGSTMEEAIRQSGVSKSTAKIQMAKWKKSGGVAKVEEDDIEVTED